MSVFIWTFVCVTFFSYEFADNRKIQHQITQDKNACPEIRDIHLQNLQDMVGYCENAIDCRRMIQVGLLTGNKY